MNEPKKLFDYNNMINVFNSKYENGEQLWTFKYLLQTKMSLTLSFSGMY